MLLSWKGQRQLLGAPGQGAFRQEIGNTEPQKPYAAATRLGCRQKPWQLGKHIVRVGKSRLICAGTGNGGEILVAHL